MSGYKKPNIMSAFQILNNWIPDYHFHPKATGVSYGIVDKIQQIPYFEKKILLHVSCNKKIVLHVCLLVEIYYFLIVYYRTN